MRSNSELALSAATLPQRPSYFPELSTPSPGSALAGTARTGQPASRAGAATLVRAATSRNAHQASAMSRRHEMPTGLSALSVKLIVMLSRLVMTLSSLLTIAHGPPRSAGRKSGPPGTEWQITAPRNSSIVHV